MTPTGPPSDPEIRAMRRENLLQKLSVLRDAMRRTNSPFAFADIRNLHPEVAEMLFCGRDLRNTDFRNADLRGIDFRGSDLSDSDFSGSVIEGARFEWARVSRSSLFGARDWKAYRANWEPSDRSDRATAFFIRDPGERFSLSPWLPELVTVPSSLVPDPSRLDDDERRHLFAGCLAIARRPLTNWEYARVILPSYLGGANEERDRRLPYHAESYCARLNRDLAGFGLPTGTRVTAPSHTLFHALAEAGLAESPAAGAGDSEDMTLSRLDLGVDGPEFVRVGNSSDHPFATCGIDERSGHALPFAQGDGARAVLRPAFLLGER